MAVGAPVNGKQTTTGVWFKTIMTSVIRVTQMAFPSYYILKKSFVYGVMFVETISSIGFFDR